MDKSAETDITSDGSFELASRGERQDLTYKVSFDGTAKAVHSAIQAALHEAILECTSKNPTKIPSSDKLDDFLPS
jgi:hypothetical protein